MPPYLAVHRFAVVGIFAYMNRRCRSLLNGMILNPLSPRRAMLNQDPDEHQRGHECRQRADHQQAFPIHLTLPRSLNAATSWSSRIGQKQATWPPGAAAS